MIGAYQHIGFITTVIGIFLIPGFLICTVLFPPGTLRGMEKLLYSFVISACLLPLGMVYATVFGLEISILTVMSVVYAIVFLSVVILLLRAMKET